MNSTKQFDLGQVKLIKQMSASIAGDTTINLSNATGEVVHITGSSWTCTSLGTVDAGISYELIFDGSGTLTYNATSLILPGASSIVTQAGDSAIVVSEGSGNWKCMFYQRATDEYIDFATTITGFTTNPAYTCKYSMVTTKLYHFILRPNIAVSNATTCTFTTPFNAPNYSPPVIPCWIYDNSVAQAGYMQRTANSNVVSLLKINGGSFTASGNKNFQIDVMLNL